ncbi:MAG: hypothetical protein Q9222_000804 [Ikaeria aurantiellina]
MRASVLWLSLTATAAAFSIKNVDTEKVLASEQHASAAPVEVELGCEIHTGALNPPVGPLRFARPEKPNDVKGQKPTNDGSVGHICHQAQAHWVYTQQEFIEEYSKGPFLGNIRPWTDNEYIPDYPELPKGNPRVSEDCLQLDFIVPQEVFDKREEPEASVVMWFHGGGFVLGEKNQHGSPVGLIDAARKLEEGIIWADDKQEKAIYDTLLSKAGVTSLKELREVDEEVRKNASNLMIQQSPYGTFTFAAAVDDDYTPLLLSLLRKSGYFWRNVRTMIANNGDEGLLFAPPHIQSDTAFRSYVNGVFPAMSTESLDEVLTMYPVGGSWTRRRNFVDRTKQALADARVNCNTRYLTKAYDGSTLKYVFNMFPAIHGLDTLFTYYAPPVKKYPARDEKGQINALELQSWIASFVTLGSAVGRDGESHPFDNLQGDGTILELSGKLGLKGFTKAVWKDVDITEVPDVWVSERCNFWENAPYWGGEIEGPSNEGLWEL